MGKFLPGLKKIRLVQQPMPSWQFAFDLPGQGGIFNSLNLASYTYVQDNPAKNVDPDGRLTLFWQLMKKDQDPAVIHALMNEQGAEAKSLEMVGQTSLFALSAAGGAGGLGLARLGLQTGNLAKLGLGALGFAGGVAGGTQTLYDITGQRLDPDVNKVLTGISTASDVAGFKSPSLGDKLTSALGLGFDIKGISEIAGEGKEGTGMESPAAPRKIGPTPVPSSQLLQPKTTDTDK